MESEDQSTMRIAVYTYNIGGYEAMRSDFVPCVPPGVDAFLFIDEVGMRRFGKTVKQWQDLGWHIRNFTQIPGTKHVSGPRLTSKSLNLALVGGTRWKHRSGSASLAALCAETAEAFVSFVELGLPHRLHRRWVQMLHDGSLQHAD